MGRCKGESVIIPDCKWYCSKFVLANYGIEVSGIGLNGSGTPPMYLKWSAPLVACHVTPAVLPRCRGRTEGDRPGIPKEGLTCDDVRGLRDASGRSHSRRDDLRDVCATFWR